MLYLSNYLNNKEFYSCVLLFRRVCAVLMPARSLNSLVTAARRAGCNDQD